MAVRPGTRRAALLPMFICSLFCCGSATAQSFLGGITSSTVDARLGVDGLIFGDGSRGSGLEELFELPLNDPPNTNFTFNEPARAYAFANANNRFYAGLVTGTAIVPAQTAKGVEGWIDGFYKSPVYVKGLATSAPTFRISPSFLEIKPITRSHAVQLDVAVYVCSKDRILLADRLGNPIFCLQQATLFVEISGNRDPNPSSDNHTLELTRETIDGEGLVPGVFTVNRSGRVFPKADSARYDLPRQTGQLNVDALEVGDSFYVKYYFTLKGISFDEGASRAHFGDPLEVDGGLTLEVSDELADPQPELASQQCGINMLRVTPDDRFVPLPQGTVHDLQTDLQWPRCPQGHDLDDAGTADLADDSCIAVGTTEFDWQAALLEGIDAAGRGDYGHNDWRLPNAKELTTLVETACTFPAMNTNLFPESATSNIWTNTPSDFNFAFAVDFNSGRLDTQSQVAAQYGVRLVRTEENFTPPLSDGLFSDGFE